MQIKRKSRRLTLAVFLVDRWLPSAANTVRATTLTGYRGHALNHIVPRMGDLPLTRLTPRHLNDFYAELRSNGRVKGTGPLGPVTVRRIHGTLHRALNDAVKWGLIAANPASAADPPRLEHPAATMRIWTASQLRSFLETTEGDDLHPLWVLLATTGMRRGEVLGLRWGDVDLARAVLAVRQTAVTVEGQIRFSEPKSARSRRVIALDDFTCRVLGQRLAKQRPESSQLVFSSPDGSPLDPAHVSKTFRLLVEDSGLPLIRLHDLRHTHATLALQAGVHPKIVSERLGHSTVALTLDVYSHALSHLQEEAATRIGRLVFGSTERVY
ncbi:MAG: tyrosine-type recombinase/integrase [Actinomycetota bacterium]|nr:tyrosine-type recombinase/integrase [Actinomycetota bacterium]